MSRNPIAYVCPKRQIYVINTEGLATPQTSATTDALVWGSWAPGSSHRVGHSWPTWSPDGTQIACFRIPQGGAPRVLVMETNGISSSEVVDLGPRLPIYLYWSPNGSQIAVLSQSMDNEGDKLSLSTIRPSQLGQERPVAEGTPLFFTWSGERVAAYIGGSDAQSSRLSVSDPNGHSATEILPGIPGNFCAPVSINDTDLVYVAAYNGSTQVLRTTVGSSVPQAIHPVNGLVGLVSSPDKKRIAMAVAPGGDGTAYRNLSVLDVASGRVQHIVDLPCLGFFWTPDSTRLVVVSVDTHRNLMTWSVVHLNGDIDPITEMVPTRDFGFYLRFFEQYSQSHPIISHDSKHLLVSGELFGEHGQGQKAGTWKIPLNGARPTRICDGVFAVYGPSPIG